MVEPLEGCPPLLGVGVSVGGGDEISVGVLSGGCGRVVVDIVVSGVVVGAYEECWLGISSTGSAVV